MADSLLEAIRRVRSPSVPLRVRCYGPTLLSTRRLATMSNPTPEDRDERVVLPLDPEEALKALLAVAPADDERDKDGKTQTTAQPEG